MPYERPNIHALTAYTPGEQPAVLPGERIVKLNTNENPYPPPAQVLQAIQAVTPEQLRRYPPPLAQRFRETAAHVHGLVPEQVIAVNGGDELLRLAITVFCQPQAQHASACVPHAGSERSEGPGNGGLAITDPTYSLYSVLAAIHDTPIARIRLDKNWAIPDDFAQRVLAANARLVIVVNPHAPSGHLESLEKLESIARALEGRAVLLIDEAYVDFAQNDALPLLDRGGDNVLLLRTLSKGYSLAGLRFGYGLGHPDLIAALDKARDSYNTDALAQVAAIAALENRDAAQETWRKVIDERTRLAAALRDRGFHVAPSDSNFLLVGEPASAGGKDATSRGASCYALYRALADRRIFVRYFDQDRLRDKLRITVGTPEQNDILLATLDECNGTLRVSR